MVNGTADVGFVASGYIESLVASGTLSARQLKIVNELSSPPPLAGFPLPVSVSVMLPAFALVAMPTPAAAEASKGVTQALLDLRRENPIAIKADYGGWVRMGGAARRSPALSCAGAGTGCAVASRRVAPARPSLRRSEKEDTADAPCGGGAVCCAFSAGANYAQYGCDGCDGAIAGAPLSLPTMHGSPSASPKTDGS